MQAFNSSYLDLQAYNKKSTGFFPSWSDSFSGTQTHCCVFSTGNKWTKNPNSLVKGLWKKNNFHRSFLRCILSLLQIITAFLSKGLSFTYSLNYCLPSSIHKLSIRSSPTLPSFKRLPFLRHNIPCRALQGLKARQ